MVVDWLLWRVLPFPVVYALLWNVLRAYAGQRADFDAREESAQALREYRGNGYAVAVIATAVVAVLNGFGTGVESLATDGALLDGIVPPFVLRLVVLVYGPLLVGAVAVHDAVAPYHDALVDLVRSRREAVERLVTEYVLVTLPFLALALLVYWVPSGFTGGVALAVATLAHHATGPFRMRWLRDPREPTAEERALLDGVDGPGDVSVWIIEADVDEANGYVSGLVPGYRAVYLTDYLVEAFAPEEASAVLAHEYAHVRKGHVLKTAALQAGCIGFAYWAWTTAMFNGPTSSGGLVILIVFAAYLAGRNAQGTKHEFLADRAAAQQVGAETMARALDRLADVNVVPRSTLDRRLFGYPPMDERIRRLDPAVARGKPAIPTRT